MYLERIRVFTICLLILLFALAGCSVVCPPKKLNWRSPYAELSSVEDGDIIHIPTGVKISKEQLIDMLAGARIVYVGETHDNVNSHRVQLEILKALAERYPNKIAVGLEMLKRSSQDSADLWTAGQLQEKELVRVWAKDWTNDFGYFRSILEYVRDNNIPLRALRAPDSWLKGVKRTESSSQLEEDTLSLPEMDLEDPYHLAHTKAFFQGHPGSSQGFEGFYRVQVLWDESMATGIAEYLLSEAGQDKRMLVFAGGHHVEFGYGIPRRVFKRLPLPYATVLPTPIHVPPEKAHKFMDVKLPEIPLALGDFFWMVTYEDLEDQKVYLGVMIRGVEEGVKVLRPIENSAAQKAGLQKDDIITTFDGEPIKTTFDLTYLVSLKKPGDTATVGVLRDKESLSFEVTLKAVH